jgi:uncharacterized protein YndB with AHSA1/START domain/uncharacterized protein YciI
MNRVATPNAARAVADVGQGTIIATVVIEAPIERVFAALTVPEEVARWWGSDDTYRITDWESDPRVGGRWRSAGRSKDGQTFGVEGEYLEMDPPRKLVQSWKYSWDGGGEPTTVTFRLDTVDGATRVTVRHEGFEGRPQSCESHRQGWERVLDWLADYLRAAQPAEPATFYFLLRLRPPRPSFAQDMRPEEMQVMQQHVEYWKMQLHKGVAIAFGPVADPEGAWGVGLVEVAGADELAALQQADPAIRSGIGMRYEALPMPRLMVRGGS